MPLSEKARIEIYLPDSPQNPIYQDLLDELREEFAWAFGGCSIVGNVRGTFRESTYSLTEDTINILYTDLPFSLEKQFEVVSDYADTLQKIVATALDAEEAVLITVSKIYWAG